MSVISAVTTDGDTAELRQRLRARIDAGRLEVPMLPRVAGEVLQLVSQPDVDARRLAKLLHQDAGLASHVLRIANSPAYMPARPIVSLQQAIARLGTRLLGEVAFAACVQARAFDVPGAEHLVSRFWRESIATAGWGREVARQLRVSAESAFLCGLLCRIGMPIVLQGLWDLTRRGARPSEDEALALCHEHYHLIGRQIAVTWALPEVIAAVAGTPEEAEAPEAHRSAVWICRAARGLIPVLHEAEPEGQAAFAALDIYPEDVERILGGRARVEKFIAGMGG